MRKRFLMTLPLLAMLFSSCGGDAPSDPGTQQESETEKKIKEIYELYKANGGELTYEEWLATIKGEKGDTGDPGKDGATLLSGIGEPSVNLGNPGDMYLDTLTYDLYTKTSSGWTKTGNFKGNQGDPGVSVVSISKTGENNNIDTYTITYSDGNTSTFTVTNGVDGQSIKGDKGEDGHTPIITIENGCWVVDGVSTGISATGPKGDQGDPGVSVVSISKTGENDNIDTYTITYSDGNTSTFTVTNGVDGSQGIQGIPGQDGHTPEISISSDGYWIIDGQKTTTLAQGPQGEQGIPGQDGKDGQTPYIGENGNWWIGESDTGVKAEGSDGKSAYELALENGFVGTLEEWLESLKGKDGDTPQLPEKFVVSITYDNNVIYVHYSDGTVEAINLGGGDTPVDPGEDPGDEPVPGEIVYPGIYNKENASQYDELTNNWSEPGHLYVHYLRYSAKTFDDYDNYGMWVWQSRPVDSVGTLWGAPIGKYDESLHAMSNERMTDIGGTKLNIDDFGVVYDLNLSSKDLIDGKDGKSIDFTGSTTIGFLLVQLSSTLSGSTHWNSDGGREVYIDISGGWTSTTSKHIYVMEGDVSNYCNSASSFASNYFPDVVDDFEVQLSATSVTREVGEQYQLTWTTNKPCEVVIQSSNTDVANVDQTGLVTAVGVGVANINFIFNTGVTASCAFTIKEKETPEENINLYFFLDYNQTDFDKPYFKTMIANDTEYNFYNLGLIEPTNNPNSPGAKFVGWSIRPIIFSDDDLLDLSKASFSTSGYSMTIYGIWEFES